MDTVSPKGPWINRFAVKFFAVVLFVIFYWLLGFIVDDIDSIKGPKYDEFEKGYLDKNLQKENEDLDQKLNDVNNEIKKQKSRQEVIGDSTNNLKKTIDQLTELQKVSIQKNIEVSDQEKKTFNDSLNLFIENQRNYQEISEIIAKLNDDKNLLQEKKYKIESDFKKLKEPARKEFDKLMRRHNNKIAFIQLSILVPILLIACFVFYKKKNSAYMPIYLAFAVSAFLKVTFVVHEHFPSRFFKYVLIFASLLIVVKVLVMLIKSIVAPKKQYLVKQYREAYERFLCPVCEYPIRRGPMKYLYWTRRSIMKIKAFRTMQEADSAYTCPACGTHLFEECGSCHLIRHALLPSCEHCGKIQENM